MPDLGRFSSMGAVAGAVLLAVVAPASGSEIRSSANGAVVAGPNVESRLISEGLAVDLDAGEQVSVHGWAIGAETPALLYLTETPGFLSIAVLEGRVSAADLSLQAGQVGLLGFDGAAAQRYHFDAARFGASLPPVFISEFAPALEQVRRRQQRAMFWGLLEPAGRNGQVAATDSVDSVRRTYALDPAVIEIRRAAGGDVALLREGVTARFVEAYNAGDAAVMASLLDPAPFLEAGLDWRAAREAYARSLATTGGQGEASLTLTTRDGLPFVSAIETGSGDLVSHDLAADFARGYAANAATPETLLMAAEVARRQMAGGMAGSDVEAQLLGAAFGAPLQSALVSWFAGGASAYPVTSTEADDFIAYYNPLADMVLLTSWRRDAAQWRITNAAMVDGGCYRDAGRSWVVAEGVMGAREFLTIAEATHSGLQSGHLTCAEPATQALLEARVVRLNAQVYDAEMGADTQAIGRRIAAALARGAPESLGLEAADAPGALQLQALDPMVRSTLSLAAAAPSPGGYTLAIASPLRPDLIFFCDLDADLKVRRISPVNLRNLGLQAAALQAQPEMEIFQ